MKTFVVLATFLGASAYAAAQSLTVNSQTISGSGCPQSPATNIIVTPSTVFYAGPSSWKALAGPTVPRASTSANCKIDVDVNIPDNWKFKFIETRNPINATTPRGNEHEVTNVYYFASDEPSKASGVTTVTTTGVQTVVNTYDPLHVWSTCGGSDTLTLNSNIRAFGNGVGDIEYIGGVSTDIFWEAC
ncbi:hypothetical protein D9611_011161 [Ephemerocybe angulata]|uniref:Secreted protein n=1 Tax=Ephemerocybe angulata TaxID=980116 RepID=A0A8H5FJK0_9AGAR|nr:hypothetical protein D9611_011161 [Tulosesus angulatus]